MVKLVKKNLIEVWLETTSNPVIFYDSAVYTKGGLLCIADYPNDRYVKYPLCRVHKVTEKDQKEKCNDKEK